MHISSSLLGYYQHRRDDLEDISGLLLLSPFSIITQPPRGCLNRSFVSWKTIRGADCRGGGDKAPSSGTVRAGVLGKLSLQSDSLSHASQPLPLGKGATLCDQHGFPLLAAATSVSPVQEAVLRQE